MYEPLYMLVTTHMAEIVSRFFPNLAEAHICACWRPHRRPVLVHCVPTDPSVALEHRPAGLDRPDAASEPPDAPNGVNLAPMRSRRHEERGMRPRGGLPTATEATEGTPHPARTPPTLPQPVRTSLAASARVRRPLMPARAAQRPRRLVCWARRGSAARALWPVPTRQTGRGESGAMRARGPDSEAAAAAASGSTNDR